MAIGKSFVELENNISYKFSDTSILENALTHASYSNEYKTKGLSIPSNERLEFLGDAVLEIVISEYLYDNFKSFGEGKLTRMRQQLVCEKTLAKIAAELNLNDYLCLGSAEEANDCRNRPKVLADCFEAIIAALYLDIGQGTSEFLSDIILKLFIAKIDEIANAQDDDYKSMLQQFSEQDGYSELRYESVQTGMPHAPEFTSVAFINNNAVGRGTANSKKDAEMAAAKEALELFGII